MTDKHKHTQEKYWAELSKASPVLSIKVTEFIEHNTVESKIVLNDEYVRIFPKTLSFYGTLDERKKIEKMLIIHYFIKKNGKKKNVFEGSFYGKNSMQKYGSNCLCEFQARRQNNKRRRCQKRFFVVRDNTYGLPEKRRFA